jgi:hypothetical protein
MKKISSISILTFILNGCMSISIQPGAARVILSPNPAPKGCKYLGQLVGNQGNFFTGKFTSNPNLEKGAMNDLRNKANKLGANYVHLIVNRAGRNENFVLTNVTNVGNAYLCPSNSI